MGKEFSGEWIPVSQELPPEYQDVLLVFDGKLATGYRIDIGEQGEPLWKVGGWHRGSGVTHWAEMIEVPESE